MLSPDDVVASVLSDLSSAFDMIEHNIFIYHLESYVGIQGTVFKWFRSL